MTQTICYLLGIFHGTLIGFAVMEIIRTKNKRNGNNKTKTLKDEEIMLHKIGFYIKKEQAL